MHGGRTRPFRTHELDRYRSASKTGTESETVFSPFLRSYPPLNKTIVTVVWGPRYHQYHCVYCRSRTTIETSDHRSQDVTGDPTVAVHQGYHIIKTPYSGWRIEGKKDGQKDFNADVRRRIKIPSTLSESSLIEDESISEGQRSWYFSGPLSTSHMMDVVDDDDTLFHWVTEFCYL